MKSGKRRFLVPLLREELLFGCLNMKVLQLAYKSPEHSLGLRKDRLDTRLFTSPHVLGLLR